MKTKPALPDEGDVTKHPHDAAMDGGDVPYDQDYEKFRNARRRHLVAMWCPFPPRMGGKESRSDYIRGAMPP